MLPSPKLFRTHHQALPSLAVSEGPQVSPFLRASFSRQVTVASMGGACMLVTDNLRDYSTQTMLRDGTLVCLRAIGPDG